MVDINKLISIVIPAFNEDSNIDVISERISTILSPNQFELIFVDDGSSDNTLLKLKKLHSEKPFIHFVSFSKNFGHQSALKAGLDFADGDCVITMDADLQHPPELLPQMIEKWIEGFDIVYTVRKDSKELSYFKRKTSVVFYKTLNKIGDIKLEPGSADYRLLDRTVVNLIKQSKEYNLFLRGFIAWVGFKKFKIDYEPNARYSGTSKFSVIKMMKLAMNGFTSFSIRPLYFATVFGGIVSLLAFLYALYAAYIKLFTNRALEGWTSILISVLFIGGIQLITLGIIGQYIGMILKQTKSRPDYIVRESSKKRLM